MNPDYHIYEQIDRYLKNNLSKEELVQFNEKLLNDVEFKETFEAQKDAHELLVDNELIKLKERMSRDLSTQGDSDSSNWGKILLLSAAIGSVAVFSYIQYNNYKSVPDSVKEESVSDKKDLSLYNNENKDIASKENSRGTTTVTKLSSAENDTRTKSNQAVVSDDNTQPDKLNGKTEPLNTVITLTETVKINSENKNPLPENSKTIIDCQTTEINATVKVEYNKEEATILVDKSSVHGGKAPYLFSLTQRSFDTDNRFETTKDGNYHVYIKDQNGCISEIKKEITVKIPQKDIDDAFAPSMGEKWSFPVKDNTDATISIINKAGQTVYNVTINGGYPNEWDGRDTNGNELNAGNYYFIINFTNNELLKGHISIVK